MRDIKYIVVHCSGGSRRNTADDIVRYHTAAPEAGGLGWSRPGYHFIIEADGRVVAVYPVDMPSNGVGRRFNAVSVNVCWVGGVDTSTKNLDPVDNRTPAQKASLRALLKELKTQFPEAVILGHRDLPDVHKACPCFDAISEYADI